MDAAWRAVQGRRAIGTDSGKQAISDLLEAGEQYLLGFIRLAKEGRMDTDDLTVKRNRLIDAIDNVRKAEEDNRL